MSNDDECGVRLYRFACMLNHVHLLCETPQANLSGFMHKLQTGYTVYHNLRHRRAGHLMQGRFGVLVMRRFRRRSGICIRSGR